MSNLGNLMKQAQAMQENLQKAQRELAEMEVQGQAGGGMVTVTMTCRHDVRKVDIAPQLMEDEREILEDLIAAALNDAVRKVEEVTQEKMGGLTAGMQMPGIQLP